jgi:hypothetical protein
MYLAVNTRPDIVYAVSVLSRFLTNPSEKYMAAGMHVLQYLKGTIYMAIVFGGKTTNGRSMGEEIETPSIRKEMELIGYSDSD